MNYVWFHLKNNPRFWIKVIVIPAVLALTLLDFLSHMFRPPGIFNLWFFRMVILTVFIGIVGYGIYLYVSPRREKKIRLAQFEFEKKREVELRKILSENPEFQTFCYTCRNFNQPLKCCTLDIKNPKARKIRLSEKYTYCLYWDTEDGVEKDLSFRSEMT